MRPLRSMLPALLVENKLLVSQRRAGGPWTQKCARCGAAKRVAGRFHPTACDKPAGEMGKRSPGRGGGILHHGRMCLKSLSEFFFSRLVIRNGGKCARTECAEFLVTRLLLLFWMDYISHLPFDDSFPVTQSSDPIIEFNVNQLKQPRILHW